MIFDKDLIATPKPNIENSIDWRDTTYPTLKIGDKVHVAKSVQIKTPGLNTDTTVGTTYTYPLFQVYSFNLDSETRIPTVTFEFIGIIDKPQYNYPSASMGQKFTIPFYQVGALATEGIQWQKNILNPFKDNFSEALEVEKKYAIIPFAQLTTENILLTRSILFGDNENPGELQNQTFAENALIDNIKNRLQVSVPSQSIENHVALEILSYYNEELDYHVENNSKLLSVDTEITETQKENLESENGGIGKLLLKTSVKENAPIPITKSENSTILSTLKENQLQVGIGIAVLLVVIFIIYQIKK